MTLHDATAGDAPRRGAGIPAFVNAAAGTATAALEALRSAGDVFDVREVDPRALGDELRRVVAGGAERVVVAGGDGTVGTAAAAVAGSDTALAVLPGGTLNHFARDHDIPTDAAEAARLAAVGAVVGVDVGYVNGELFLNTSSVGAYVLFVRTRERLERWLGYRAASFVAGLRILTNLRPYRVTLDVEGTTRVYRTPIVFIGVGERELRVPLVGARVGGGRRGLHVLVVRSRTAGRLFALALAAAARGVDDVARSPLLDSFVVDRCRIDLPRPRGRVALDGELVEMRAPLEYEVRRGALRVVTATAGPGESGVGNRE
ncbi:MAG: diacylglycerol/lipid kinase family protein [Gemmatimonadaceae bacterium]